MRFEELNYEDKVEALVDSAKYLADEFSTNLLEYSDVEFIKNNKLTWVCEALLLDMQSVKELSREAKEQIIDEAVQYGIEHGY